MRHEESKEDAFKRVAQSRTKRILKDLELMANLSNSHNYAFTKEQVDKIFDTIEVTMKEARGKFSFKRSDDFAL